MSGNATDSLTSLLHQDLLNLITAFDNVLVSPSRKMSFIKINSKLFKWFCLARGSSKNYFRTELSLVPEKFSSWTFLKRRWVFFSLASPHNCFSFQGQTWWTEVTSRIWHLALGDLSPCAGLLFLVVSVLVLGKVDGHQDFLICIATVDTSSLTYIW